MTLVEVAVVDYGAGNLLSVKRGLEKCGARVCVTSDPARILSADRVVLPGVGAFGAAMHALETLGLVAVLREISHKQIPLLGICLGMQLLLQESEEYGCHKGLGLIPGRVVHLPQKTVSGITNKIPEIGWNSLQISPNISDWRETILNNCKFGDSVYFVHSFMALPKYQSDRIADYDFGGHAVSAVIGRGKVTGCQFHPEKSGEVGLKILKKFIEQ